MDDNLRKAKEKVRKLRAKDKNFLKRIKEKVKKFKKDDPNIYPLF